MDETIKCVDSIKEKCKNDNYDIVIVENGSPNNSSEELKKIYLNDKKIHLLFSDKNLGFAKGNNIGFKYIKENLKSDFIVMINNDIIIIQDDFCDRIIREYSTSKFALLGPKIYLPNNIVFEFPDKIKSVKEYKKILFKTKIFYILNKIHFRYLYTGYDKFLKKITKKEKVNVDIRKENVLLNGCCLIFSREYITKFDGIDDRTFLYYEEQLLFLRLKKNNLKSVFNPSIEILHNESVSTKKSKKNKRKRYDFVLKNEIKSLNILIDELRR